MGKISDQQLAELISKRILEIIDLTGLTIESLASFANVSTSTIRSAYRKTSSLSVDSLSKICTPFAISLTDFFDPALSLKIEEENLSHLKRLKQAYTASTELKHLKLPMDERVNRSEYHRKQRDLIAKIVHESDYFDSPKTIDAMIIDFRKDYQMTFTTDRLYALLLKHLGSGLLDKKALPKVTQRMPASKRPYLYFKKESKKQE
ncbi:MULTISPECIES: helix-turn-helix domain-containing protein [unclassified Sphingobacterium]|uniref:helix-turn-helix domain-containing protein n=1 Tax=unclassified Sphingobacterium TaxID=2609468 RepID=UPI0025F5F5E8|nr:MULTISPECIES: hypothetical protein [unclassified Sphingobacterium]